MILSAGTLASCMLQTKLFLQRWTFASHSVRLPSLSSSQPSSSSSQPSSSRPNRSGQLCGAGHWLHQLRAHLHLPGDRPLHHNGKSDSLRAGIDWNLSRATAGLAQCCKGLWRRMRRWVLLTITIIIINIIIIITIIITITIITISIAQITSKLTELLDSQVPDSSHDFDPIKQVNDDDDDYDDVGDDYGAYIW